MYISPPSGYPTSEVLAAEGRTEGLPIILPHEPTLRKSAPARQRWRCKSDWLNQLLENRCLLPRMGLEAISALPVPAVSVNLLPLADAEHRGVGEEN
jgi:hypothetical protein